MKDISKLEVNDAKKWKKPIFPISKKCVCGKSVDNHHFLCNTCWGIKSKNNKIVLDILKKREISLKRQVRNQMEQRWKGIVEELKAKLKEAEK